MPVLKSIQQLYASCDLVFSRPTSFYNERCCVTEENERILLTIQREDLTEEMLTMPIDHFGSCFGTFEQVSYYVPRLIELLAESRYGFEYGVMCYSFFRLLHQNEQQYRTLGIWDQIENAVNDIFIKRTLTFTMERHNYVDYTDLIDNILSDFYYPVLSKRRLPGNESATEWDHFFIQWEEDQNPHRIAHMLDTIKRHHECNPDSYTLPNSLLDRLKNQDYILSLIDRAKPACLSLNSQTWLTDLITTIYPKV